MDEQMRLWALPKLPARPISAPSQTMFEHWISAPHPRRRGAAAEAEIVRAVRVDLGADTVSDGAAI